MDFLKTLMLYMTMTFATAVQGAPTPEITQVPAETPAAEVSTQLPAQGEETVTPGVTVTLAPQTTAEATKTPVPVATMTPNPDYKTLQKGDRGDKVKALQVKLIALGYLTGEADGAYGNQTRRAVQRFQYYNGLQQDGVAGKATQTHLFEDPDVISNPDAATPTIAPTNTPAPATDTPAATIAAPAASTDTAEPTVVPPANQMRSAALSAPEGATDAPDASPDAAALTATVSDLATQTDLAALGLTPAENAAMVLNSAGKPLTLLRQEDGVKVESSPRVYLTAEGEPRFSLTDLCAAVEGWSLAQDEDGVWTMTAAGYTVVMTSEDGVMTVELDGQPLALDDGDLSPADGDLIASPAFLEKALAAQTTWDAEELTLMLTIPDKAAGNEG